MMNDSPSYYANIPAPVRYHENLVPNAKLLYGEITALCNKEGFCWATNEYFANLYKKDVLTISRWISSLEKAEFIKVLIDQKDNVKRKIYLQTSIQKNQELLTKKSRAIDEKINASIYSINNTINTEGKAVYYLIQNHQIRFETDFLMPYKKQFKDDEQFNAFLNDFNDEVILSGKPYTAALFGMLTKYARNWIASKAKYDMKVIKNEDANVKQANKHLDAAI